MNLKKLTLILFISFSCYSNAVDKTAPHVLTIDDVYFNENTILEYTADYENIIIPEKLDNMIVKNIDHGAFSRSGVSRVVIPNSVTTIKGEEFRNNALIPITLIN